MEPSKESNMSRQLDILWTNRDWYTLPKNLPGRLMADDFVFFVWPESVDPKRYKIAVETLDVSGDSSYRLVSPLKKQVELPHVRFDPHARIGVLPDTDKLPVFEAELVRGSTYVLPTPQQNGWIQMERHGVHRPN